jgi:signal transduction histidine kinase
VDKKNLNETRLAISKQIVELHGGSIKVLSKEGETIFSVPLRKQNQ